MQCVVTSPQCRGSDRTVVAVTVLAVVAFIPAAHYGFVWDDILLIQKNQFLQQGNLRSLLSRDFSDLTFGALGGGLYRPLFALTLWADAEIWGLQPIGFHLTNLLLHGLVAMLLWFLVRRLSDTLTATLTSTLFAIHPAHSEVAVFISGRVDSLPLISMLGGLWLFLELDGCQSLGKKWLCHSGLLAAAVLALAAKESAIVFPGLLLTLGLTDKAGAGWQFLESLRATLRKLAGVLIVVGIYAVCRFAMLTGYVSHVSGNVDVVTRILIAAESFGYYTTQALWPVPLGPERYPTIPHSPFDLPVLLGWVSLVFVACWLRWAWGRRPLAAVGLLWFVCALVPVLAALPVTRAGEFVLAERWLYTPSAGMILAVGATVRPWLIRIGNPVPLRFVGAITLTWATVALGTLLWITPIWANNTTFHQYVLARNPDAPGPLTNAAILETEAGRPENALRLLQKAAMRSPADAKIWVNLGLALRQMKRYEEALVAFQKSIDLNPDWVFPPTFMSSVYYDTGRHAEGIALMQSVVQRTPHYAYGYFFLGVFYESSGRLDDAVTAYRETIRLTPRNLNAYRNLAGTQVRMGSLGAAVATLEEGLAVFPGVPRLQVDLAQIYHQAGENAKARSLWEAVAAKSADAELSQYAAGRLAR